MTEAEVIVARSKTEAGSGRLVPLTRRAREAPGFVDAALPGRPRKLTFPVPSCRNCRFQAPSYRLLRQIGPADEPFQLPDCF